MAVQRFTDDKHLYGLHGKTKVVEKMAIEGLSAIKNTSITQKNIFNNSNSHD